MGSHARPDGQDFDASFKVLLVGNSGVGKTCLLTRFQKNLFDEETVSTIGVDFAIKKMWVNDLLVRLAIWDTAGQERFRTLTSTYYRGAKGVIFVYDVTSRETMDAISEFWIPEVLQYCTNGEEPIKMLVANKVDMSSEREVSWEEGSLLAQQAGCLFVETSAKTNVAVDVAFEELVLKVLESPTLLPKLHQNDGLLDLMAQPAGRSYCC